MINRPLTSATCQGAGEVFLGGIRRIYAYLLSPRQGCANRRHVGDGARDVKSQFGGSATRIRIDTHLGYNTTPSIAATAQRPGPTTQTPVAVNDESNVLSWARTFGTFALHSRASSAKTLREAPVFFVKISPRIPRFWLMRSSHSTHSLALSQYNSSNAHLSQTSFFSRHDTRCLSMHPGDHIKRAAPAVPRARRAK